MPAAHAEDRRTRRAIAIRSLAATTWVERRSRCTPTSPPPHRRSRKSLHGRTRLGLVKCRSRANAPARPFFPGPSEAEVGERLVNPSRARNRSRSRHAYRHISSLRSASRWHMIAVRQAGSFHTGRSAQLPRRRKPISPVTSVAEASSPGSARTSIRQVHPSAAMAREAVDCGVPSGPRLFFL